ncbi:hypothetical protein [Janthinobacterium lividum]|uniref:hypothetical protein n=1 Tax=Janthinobacterium lividum TaxID=29581 RepID=UPI000893C926|nr:hypothetical protein [Janthinobacterium lividum]MCC7712985.1 hypothetical protein [Janthinobacterium lividum]OEZ57492.1 hypothetical protein JANLI_26190 [Janthinobacterium lividum]WQE31422.1 hypothetical protein U0004_13725 [Janthinobacterium lividum]STQ96950.1 Uncharacterised protein [Janthinobacterium lividum]
MPSNDDSPRPSTRPSLLTPAQQAEADRSRILNHLEGGKRPAPVPLGGRRASRWPVWGGMLAGALLLLATGAWLGQRETAAVEDPVLRSTAPAAETPAAATAPVTAAASIREEEQPPPPRQSLSEMLGADLPAPVPAPVPGPRDVLSKALESPQKSAPKPARAPQKKPPAKPLKPADKAKPAATPEQESDVALLAALVSHAQAGTPPKKAPSSLQAQLQQCSKLKPAAADSCRQRTCAGRTGKPLCKAARAAAKGAQ